MEAFVIIACVIGLLVLGSCIERGGRATLGCLTSGVFVLAIIVAIRVLINLTHSLK